MKYNVAPLAGAWIEILQRRTLTRYPLSLPSRERGLKCSTEKIDFGFVESLPSRERGLKYEQLVPLVPRVRSSLPSRERGLKYG